MKTVEYNKVTFEIPTLKKEGATILPEIEAHRWPLSYHGSIWDYKHLEVPYEFISLGLVDDQTKNMMAGPLEVPRVLDMPLSMAGSAEYRIPKALAPLTGLIQKIIAYEHEICKDSVDYYAYLTLDQGIVPKYATQRKAGAHVDGFQGSRIEEKVEVSHSYTVANCLPTAFYNQGFKVSHLDPAKDNFFLEFDRQKSPEKKIQPAPYEVVLFNSYHVHEAVQNFLGPVFRTFVRISYSKRIFDRLGNTHNPLFDYDWEMVPRNISEVLK